MDIQMPNMDGIEATKIVNKNYPHIKVIMLTIYDSEQHSYESSQAGASGYLMKESSPKEIFEGLPNSPGIYYFKDAKGTIIYIGKAIDIKKRVLGHFYDKSNKEILMCKATHDIDFELSGNELIALLMESAAIKQHFPLYNQSQKRNSTEFAIFSKSSSSSKGVNVITGPKISS